MRLSGHRHPLNPSCVVSITTSNWAFWKERDSWGIGVGRMRERLFGREGWDGAHQSLMPKAVNIFGFKKIPYYVDPSMLPFPSSYLDSWSSICDSINYNINAGLMNYYVILTAGNLLVG